MFNSADDAGDPVDSVDHVAPAEPPLLEYGPGAGPMGSGEPLPKRSFVVAPGVVPVELADLADRPVAVQTHRKRITLHDTFSRDLRSAGLTLRRVGDDRACTWTLHWQPADDEDAETALSVDSRGAAVPPAIRDLIIGVRAGEPLRTISAVTTEIVYRTVRDVEGRPPVMELAESMVASTVFAPRRRTTRERWVTVRADGPDHLEAVEAVLSRMLAAGAQPVDDVPDAHDATPPDPDDVVTTSGRRAGQDAAALVRGYVRAQVEELLRRDVDLRRGRTAVHPTRVAIRRLRSVLRVFDDLFDAERAAALDTELRWYAGLLGEVRDREVLRPHLIAALHRVPPAAVLGPVAERLDDLLARESATAAADLAKAMRGARYLALVGELKSWHDEPTFAGDHAPPGDLDAGDYLARAGKTLDRKLRASQSHPGNIEAMHRARKAAKRARYVAELAEPAHKKKARDLVKRSKKLQDRLGAAHDSAVAMPFLLRAAREADAARGESAFTFGLLWEHERAASGRPQQ